MGKLVLMTKIPKSQNRKIELICAKQLKQDKIKKRYFVGKSVLMTKIPKSQNCKKIELICV